MTNAAYSPDNMFDEKVDQYDKNGNILSLKRSGWVQDWNNEEPIPGYVDYMTMTYDGNQLVNADDMVEEIFNQSPNDFYNVWDEDIQTEYLYDDNGNQYADLNKGIAWIKYNLLNLPEKIQFQNGNKIEYLYDALGVKRQAKWSYSTSTLNIPLGSTVQENNSLQGTTTTEYCGNYIYEQGQIKRLLTTEGYMTNGGYVPLILLSQWRYNYTLKDYQGNTRQTLYGNMLSGSQNVLFASGSSTIDYYPFGMEITTPEGSYTSGSNPYLYNGKEIDRMHGLNQYDYGARWRDGALPAWTTVDPLAEKYYSISPYAYCSNNPVNRIDPDGRADFWLNGKVIGNDGIDNQGIYVIKTKQKDFNGVAGAGISKKDRKATIKFIKKNSGNVEAFQNNGIAYSNSIEIESSAENRQGMVTEVSKDDGNGGRADANNREHGGSIENGKVVIAIPGAVANPKTDATANISLPSGVTTFHGHPSGTVEDRPPLGTYGGTNYTYSFTQSPSQTDINAAGTNTHYGFGRSDGAVYVYNINGIQAVIPIERFVTPKKK